MQCPSCEFQNMPGSGRCARCGGSLVLATSAIDVHPPRAGIVARRLPRFWKLKQAWGNFRLSAGRPFDKYFAAFDDTNFESSTVLRLVVPGWSVWHRGRPNRGLAFFASFLFLLIPGIVLSGTGLGSILLGLAFAIHAASAVDATIGKFADIGSRLAYTVACSAVLFLLLYLPIGILIGRVAIPIQITQAVGDFQQGEVLWYNRSSDVVAGDLVFYIVPTTRVAGRTALGNAANYVFQDQWINRILAVGGQTVTREGDLVMVDGAPAQWQAFGEFGLAPGESLVVPADCVLIPPRTLVQGLVYFDANTWRSLSIVPRGQVLGRVHFRSLPISRISRIN